jgi:hypothetical protein
MRILMRRFYAPDAGGANNSGAAAPNAGNDDTGANDAGVAAQQQPQTTPMSREDRSAAAAARRQAQAESQARIDAMTERQNALARSRGFESFDAMVEFNNNELLEQGKLTPEVLRPYISKALDEHPAIQQARAATEAGAIERSMQEFAAAFPDAGVKSVDDFLKLPNWDGFYGYVGKGLSFVDAYKLSHESDILAKRTAAAKQQALNNMNGKGHMTGSQGGADDDAGGQVPDETMSYYKNFFPNWTEKQIRSHYAKQQKG